MGIERKEKDIGGLHFEVDQLPYFAAQRLFVRLLKLAGPGLLALAQLAGGGRAAEALAALGSEDTSKLVPLLSGFFQQLEPGDVEQLTKQILATARVRYMEKLVSLVEHMDVIIGGDFWTGLAVQAFALSVHFGNFSSARGAFAALGLKASSSAESSTSTVSPDASSSAQAG